MKMIASDFDRTLYVIDKEVLTKNINAINDFRKDNNLFTIITGRAFHNIKPVLTDINVSYDYLLCGNGSMIYDNNNNLLYSNYIDESAVHNIEKIIKKYNIPYKVDNGNIYTQDIDYRKTVAVALQYEYINNEIIEELKKDNKIFCYTSPDKLNNINWLNIITSSIDKSKSLIKLEEYLNNSIDIYTIGDGMNDYEMLRDFKSGVMTIHNEELNTLSLKEYNTLHDFISEVLMNKI